MKKLFFFMVIALLLGCDKASAPEPTTTYQIVNNITKISTPTDQYLDGTIWEVIVYCYIGTDIVRQDNIESVAPAGGKSKIVEVPSGYEKVKLSMKLLPAISSYYNMTSNYRHYVVAYTVLEKGKNNIVTINDNTMTGATLSSKQDSKMILKKEFENILIWK